MQDLKPIAGAIIPCHPKKPGQIIFFVDLSEAPTPVEILHQLVEMGYNPELKYRQFKDGRVELCALLKFEQHDFPPPEDYLGDEWEKLCESGIDKSFIRCQKGHFKQPVAAA